MKRVLYGCDLCGDTIPRNGSNFYGVGVRTSGLKPRLFLVSVDNLDSDRHICSRCLNEFVEAGQKEPSTPTYGVH